MMLIFEVLIVIVVALLFLPVAESLVSAFWSLLDFAVLIPILALVFGVLVLWIAGGLIYNMPH